MSENVFQSLGCGCLQHGYARGAEIGNTLEQRRCREMAAYMQYATVAIDAFHALGYLATQTCEFFGCGKLGGASRPSAMAIARRMSRNTHGAPIEARPTMMPSTP